ncbi:MAG: hypothetical protein L3K26_17005, partial [Candidatus Hydrogenedentes bacterium]|nr:hypothetical protein [Candidatus Hydrogenedentota bacterium]
MLPVLLLAFGWHVVERHIDIEQFRPLIDKELERLIELPLTFGAMDLQLFPTPRLVVKEVTLGEEDFMVFSPSVSVTADLGMLLKRQLALGTVTIHEPRIQLSESRADFTERWGAYMLALKTPDGPKGKAMLKVTLDEIVAADLQVFRGDALFAEGALTVSDVTGGNALFTFETTGVGVVGQPEASGAFTLTVKEDPILQGEATIRGVPLLNLTGEEALPPFILDGTLDYQLSRDDRFTCNTEGKIRRDDTDASLGSFSTRSTFHAGTLALEGLRIKMPHLSFLGDLELSPGPAWTLEINEASLVDDGVNWLLAYLSMLPLRPGVDRTARCVLEHMRFGNDASGVFAIESGVVRTEGVDLVLDDPSYVIPGLRSHIAISGSNYEIRDISSDTLEVSGVLDIRDDGSIDLELQGRGNLGTTFPLPTELDEVLRLEGGTVDVKRFSTTLVAGRPVFSETCLDANLLDGAMAVWDRGQDDFISLDGIGGAIHLDNGVIHLDGLAVAGSEVSGDFEPDENFACWRFAAALRSDLSSPFWKPFYPDDKLEIASGVLSCPLVAGIYRQSDGHIFGLEIDGQVSGLKMDLSLAAYKDAIYIDTIALAAKENHVTYALQGKTENLGVLSVEGNYAPEHDIIDAAITLRPATAGRSLLPAHYWEEYGEALLGSVDAMTLQVRYVAEDHSVTFKADSPAPFAGTLRLTDRASVENLSLVADLPSSWVTEYLPESVSGSGSTEVALKFEVATGALDGTLIMPDAEGAWTPFQKPPGLTSTPDMSGR